MAHFEIVSKFKNDNLVLPTRATKHAAGYDFQAAETIVIPAYTTQTCLLAREWDGCEYTMAQMANLTKNTNARPTLVSTGMKVELNNDEYLEITARSSTPLKHWLIVANAEGIIDADYYNNPSNEGEIFFQFINLSPIPIIIKKGDFIGQGIIKKYYKTDDDVEGKERVGGLGSSH